MSTNSFAKQLFQDGAAQSKDARRAAAMRAKADERVIPSNSNTGGIDSFLKRQSASPDGAFVDWLHFTCFCSSFDAVTDDDIVTRLSGTLSSILGFGVTSQRDKGLNFYKKSYVLGRDWGFVCIGGQNDTVMVCVNGAGCMAAKDGWEKHIYALLQTLKRPRITRIDLARDFFEGEYTPDQALTDYDAEWFSLGAKMPEVEQRGNWRKPNGKGRTLYVGHRKSGKMARIYEKGLQLGRGFSLLFPKWVRVEGELGNKDREIPLDALLVPGQYLAGLYPAFKFISNQQSRIPTRKNIAKVSYDAAVNTVKHQFSPLLYVMQDIEGSAQAVLDKVVREGVPKRLNMLSQSGFDDLSSKKTVPVSCLPPAPPPPNHVYACGDR